MITLEQFLQSCENFYTEYSGKHLFEVFEYTGSDIIIGKCDEKWRRYNSNACLIFDETLSLFLNDGHVIVFGKLIYDFDNIRDLERFLKINQPRLQLSWKDIFDTSKKVYGYFDRAYEEVVNTGYNYFMWNGTLYDTSTKQRVIFYNII